VEAPAVPARLLTLTIERSGDSATDRRRLLRLHGVLTQFPGHDHFRFVFRGPGGRQTCMEFPNHPIKINDEMLGAVNAWEWIVDITIAPSA
jgi:hypothetical protein